MEVKITTGKISTTPDKNTYACTLEIPEYGKVNGKALRFNNEPKVGDEVLCILLQDPFGNDAVYLPFECLSEDDFRGIGRQGFKIEFKDGEILVNANNQGKISIKGTELKISGFSTSIEMGGTVAPTGSGPFCGLPNCLFSGAPHSGSKVVGNN